MPPLCLAILSITALYLTQSNAITIKPINSFTPIPSAINQSGYSALVDYGQWKNISQSIVWPGNETIILSVPISINPYWRITPKFNFGFSMALYIKPNEVPEWQSMLSNNPEVTTLTITINKPPTPPTPTQSLPIIFSFAMTNYSENVFWTFVLEPFGTANKVYPGCTDPMEAYLKAGNINNIMNDPNSSFDRIEKAAYYDEGYEEIPSYDGDGNPRSSNTFPYAWPMTFEIEFDSSTNAMSFSHYNSDDPERPFQECYYHNVLPGEGLLMFITKDPEPTPNAPILISSFELEYEITTFAPTTSEPSISPSEIPTQSPTDSTQSPSNIPSKSPTDIPTKAPTNYPTSLPTDDPTGTPSKHPSKYGGTIAPTNYPTVMPTTNPSTFAPSTNVPTTSGSNTTTPTAYAQTSNPPEFHSTTSEYDTLTSSFYTTTMVNSETSTSANSTNSTADQRNQDRPSAENAFLSSPYFIPLAVIMVMILCIVICILYRLSRGRNKIKGHESRFDLGVPEQKSHSFHVPDGSTSTIELQQEITGCNKTYQHGQGSDIELLESPNTFKSDGDIDLDSIVTPGSLIDKDAKDLDVDDIGFKNNSDEIIVSRHISTQGGHGHEPEPEDDEDIDALLNDAYEDVMSDGDMAMPTGYKETNGAGQGMDVAVNKSPVMFDKSVDIDALDDDGNIVDGELNTGNNRSRLNLEEVIPSVKKMNSKAEGILPGNDQNETMMEGDIELE